MTMTVQRGAGEHSDSPDMEIVDTRRRVSMTVPLTVDDQLGTIKGPDVRGRYYTVERIDEIIDEAARMVLTLVEGVYCYTCAQRIPHPTIPELNAVQAAELRVRCTDCRESGRTVPIPVTA